MSLKTPRRPYSNLDPDTIRTWRLRMGIPMSTMVYCLNVEPKTIYRWEDGTRSIPQHIGKLYRRMFKLSEYLLAQRSKPDWSL